MAVCGPIRALSSPTSCAHSCSASGSFMKVLLEDELRGHRINRLVLDAAKTTFRLHRGEPLVDSRNGQLEPPLHPPVARVDERFTSVEAESRLRGIKDRKSEHLNSSTGY